MNKLFGKFKAIVLLLSIIASGAGGVVSTALAETTPTITLGSFSEYVKTETKITENVSGLIPSFTNTGKTPINVTLKKGDIDYTNVRVVVSGLNDGIQLIAQDTIGNWYNIVKTGWGPVGGFALADATTPVYLVANTEGTYVATINLIDVNNSNTVLASTSATIIGDSTFPTMSSLTVNTDKGKFDSSGSTVTVPQGSTTSQVKVVLSEPVTLGTSPKVTVKISGTEYDYGTISLDLSDSSNKTVIITPTDSNGIAALLGDFEFKVYANSVKDLAGNGNADTTFTLKVTDQTAPVITADKFTDNESDVTGNLTYGYTINTTNKAGTSNNHNVSYKDASSNEALKNSFTPLYLTSIDGVTKDTLTTYYSSNPEPWKTYLTNALDGHTNPFAYIKVSGTTLTLIDAAHHDYSTSTDVPMIIPDDYPLGTYTVTGVVKDLADNETTVTYKLIVAGDRVAPTITIGDYNSNPTNKDVVVNAYTNEGTLNTTSYTFTENGSFSFIATDEAGNVSTKTVTITNIDKVKPEIHLIGESNINIEINSLYNDEGANASDNIDGNITLNIQTDNSVDTSKVGSYKVTYNVSDSAGNDAAIVERIVNVVDLCEYRNALGNVSESYYTSDSWAIYEGIVYANVVTVDNTQEEINMAKLNILNAQSNLITVVDYNLSVAKENEARLNSSDYIDYTAVTTALTLPETDDSAKVYKTTILNETMRALVLVSDVFESVYNTLTSQGVSNNLDKVSGSNWKNFTGLYFERIGYGKITFEKKVDLSDQNTQNFLKSLGTELDMSLGHIKLNIPSKNQLKDLGAVIEIYNLPSKLDMSKLALIVKDEDGNVLGNVASSMKYQDLGVCEVGGICTIFSFDAAHFTSFDVKVVEDKQAAPTTNEQGYGVATIDDKTSEVVITNPAQEVNITINQEAEAPKIDVSSLVKNGYGILPAMNIVSNNVNNADVVIPDETTVTADPAWNGVIDAPEIKEVSTVTTANTVDFAKSGYDRTPTSVITIGSSSYGLTFDKAVKITIPGQANKLAGYIKPDGIFHEITEICSSNDQATANLLPAGSDCKINVGNDLVIWTKHFTKFVAYSESAVPSTYYIGTPYCSNFVYDDWGKCVSGTQTRNILSWNGGDSCSKDLAVTRQTCIVTETKEENNIIVDNVKPFAEEKSVQPVKVIVPTKQVLGAKVYSVGTLLRAPDKKIYVVTKDGRLYHIKTVNELKKYYSKKEILEASSDTIDSYSKKVLGVKVYANGSLLRGADLKIYVIINGKKQHIKTIEELKSKYSNKPVFNVSDEVLNQYGNI